MNVMKRTYSLIIAAMMITSSFSQEVPAVDRIASSEGTIELHFIGHGSLMFKLDKTVLYVDPVRSSGNYENMPKADLILITHEHGDHLDPDLIRNLRKENSVILCNSKSSASVPGSKAINPGSDYKNGSVTVEAVYAYNIKNVRPDGNAYHPRGDGNGYVITYGGKRIYVAGDTENIPEMKELSRIDIAFLPMNLPFTMTPEMVADAAKSFNPAILYPYHFGNTNTSEIVSLLKNTNIEVRIRNLK
jgi:L-ascorbate metabolism protein UlaG (beta-lactamase superfamily)